MPGSDEAYYYCSVTNGSSETKTTLSAGLTVKRLVAYYPFDGNANDAKRERFMAP